MQEAEKDWSPGPCADNTSKSEKHKNKLKHYDKFTHAFHRKKKPTQILYRNADDFSVPKTHLSASPVPRTDNTNLCPSSYGFVQSTLIKESTYSNSVTEQKIVSQNVTVFPLQPTIRESTKLISFTFNEVLLCGLVCIIVCISHSLTEGKCSIKFIVTAIFLKVY